MPVLVLDLLRRLTTLLLLALAWAARDLGRWVEGDRPTTWSASVELGEVPRVQSWRRHPRCGCAWGDALASGG